MRKLPEVLTDDEGSRLLAVRNRRYPSGLRDWCVINIMLSAGLRAAEVLDLKWHGIELASGKLMVRRGKGKKDRVLWFNGILQETLGKWRARCPDSLYVFPTNQGKRQHDSALRAMVKRRGVKAGIAKDVHPHMLRHSFATRLYRESKDIRLTQKALGHADLSTTMIYTHLVDEDMEASLKAQSW